jgi:hypothetical protein
MSDKRTQEEKAEKLKSEEALKLFQENCKNYLIMNSQERSEGLKINYLLGLIKLSDNLKIDDESFIKTLFDEILFKDVINIDSSSYKYFLGVYNMPAFIRDLEENCWERLYNPVEYTKDFILLFKRNDYILTLSLISFGKVRVVVYNNDMDSQLLYEGDILCYDPIIESINI